MSVDYEWDVETVDEDGDILDHHHCVSYAEARRLCTSPDQRIVLVRDSASGRSWAYVENGKLPETFADAYGSNTAKVPQRFHEELNGIAE